MHISTVLVLTVMGSRTILRYERLSPNLIPTRCQQRFRKLKDGCTHTHTATVNNGCIPVLDGLPLEPSVTTRAAILAMVAILRYKFPKAAKLALFVGILPATKLGGRERDSTPSKVFQLSSITIGTGRSVGYVPRTFFASGKLLLRS